MTLVFMYTRVAMSLCVPNVAVAHPPTHENRESIEIIVGVTEMC